MVDEPAVDGAPRSPALGGGVDTVDTEVDWLAAGTRSPGTGDAGGRQGQGPGERAPGPPAPGSHRWSRGVVGLAVALVLVACGIGVGIGYAVHGTAPGSSPTTTVAPGGTTATGTSTLSAVAATVSRDLVDVYTTLAYETAGSAGTGMVVMASGRVVTNNHVIAGATRIKVIDLGNGKTYRASVVGYDVSDDVAVLQLQGASGLPTITFAGSTARVGDRVIAVGNAGGKGTPTAAAGVVTGLNRAITAYSELSGTTEHLTGLIETDAAIESGQSGGPLVDTKGHVVGMVTAGSAGFAVSQSDSRGYAVPAPTFRSIATDIVKERGSATVHIGATAFLGVRVMSTQAAGALVVQIVSTSPAAAAGIVPGDLIVGLGGQVVRSPETVAGVLGSARPGGRLRVDLVDQSGQQHSVTATLVAGPPA